MGKLEYYVVAPSTKLFGGIKVDKDTKFDEWNDDKTVHQTLENLVLTTEVKKEYDFNGMKSVEESKVVTTLPEGIVIVWSEEEGYVVSTYRMVRPKEAQEMYDKMMDITKPIEDTNKED